MRCKRKKPFFGIADVVTLQCDVEREVLDAKLTDYLLQKSEEAKSSDHETHSQKKTKVSCPIEVVRDPNVSYNEVEVFEAESDVSADDDIPLTKYLERCNKNSSFESTIMKENVFRNKNKQLGKNKQQLSRETKGCAIFDTSLAECETNSRVSIWSGFTECTIDLQSIKSSNISCLEREVGLGLSKETKAQRQRLLTTGCFDIPKARKFVPKPGKVPKRGVNVKQKTESIGVDFCFSDLNLRSNKLSGDISTEQHDRAVLKIKEELENFVNSELTADVELSTKGLEDSLGHHNSVEDNEIANFMSDQQTNQSEFSNEELITEALMDCLVESCIPDVLDPAVLDVALVDEIIDSYSKDDDFMSYSSSEESLTTFLARI